MERLRAAVRQGARRYRGLRGVGQEWEDAAARHLQHEGYRILARNYRTKAGEIDFVAEDGATLCFIEVKARRTPTFGSPAEAVTPEKQRRIWNAAQLYLRKARVRPVCRFDVIAIDASGASARVNLLRGAFEGPPPAPRPR
ncbi:MAG TPA: YraN family protein [Thermoanaerobaculia bacterium]|nr:YraN family protein [Thermoanaerobaculia bacterium]